MPGDPTLDLYDGACVLLDAAQQLELAAGVPGAAPAAAATLGCVEAALDTVARAVDAIRIETSAHASGARAADRAEMARRLLVLSATLEYATQAAASARGAVGPAVQRASFTIAR